PVSRLNDGFVRPDRPEEVALAYYEASLVCEYLERQHGFDALLRMLQGYGDGLSTSQVLRRVLALTPEELDQRFDRYLQDRFARPLAGVAARSDSGAPGGEFVALLESGRQLPGAGQAEPAIAALQRAQAIFPEYVD